MPSPIFHKQGNQIFEVAYAALEAHLHSYADGFFGIEVMEREARPFFYWVGPDRRVRRSPVRSLGNDNYQTLRVYHEFDLQNFKTTPNQVDSQGLRSPQASEIFSDDEKQACISKVKTATHVSSGAPLSIPFLETSSLTKEQQVFLYQEVPGYSTFAEYLAHLLSMGESGQAILTASISTHHEGLTLSPDSLNEVKNFRFLFLALNNIHQFPASLSHLGTTPSVGVIYDYYVYCIQQVLDKKVEPAHLITYSETNRNQLLGASSHDFGNEGIYNPFGLVDSHDTLYRCLRLIIQQQDRDNHIEGLQRILENSDFFAVRLGIFKALQDLIFSIENNQPPQHTENIDVYSYIEAEYPREGWGTFLLSRLQNASYVLSNILTVKEFILVSPVLSLKMQTLLFSYFTEEQCVREVGVEKLNSILKGVVSLERAGMLTKETLDALVIHDSPNMISDAIEHLNDSKILNRETFNSVCTYVPSAHVGKLIPLLGHTGVLTKSTLNIVLTQATSEEIFSSIYYLQEGRALTVDSFNALYKHDKPRQLAKAIIILHQGNLFTKETLDTIFPHMNPVKFSRIIVELAEVKELSKETLNRMYSHSYLDQIVESIARLRRFSIFTQQAVNTLLTAANSLEIMEGIRALASANMLMEETFNAICAHASPKRLAQAVGILARYEIYTSAVLSTLLTHPSLLEAMETASLQPALFNKDIFNVLCAQAHPVQIFRTIVILNSIKIYTPENLNTLLNQANSLEKMEAIWEVAGRKMLTQDTFNAVCAYANPMKLAQAITALAPVGIYTREILSTLLTHANLEEITQIISALNDAGILTKQALNAVYVHADLRKLSQAIATLARCKMLTKKNLNTLFTHADSIEMAKEIIGTPSQPPASLSPKGPDPSQASLSYRGLWSATSHPSDADTLTNAPSLSSR